MFDDLGLDNGADLDFEQESNPGDGKFDANKLLNLTDFQNK